MAQRGIKLALLGLCAGIALGLAILSVKQYLSHQLLGLLEEEVGKSCDCVFKTDGVRISLVRLVAVAYHPRIIARKNDETKLEFDRLAASFSLTDIFKKQIILSRLRLIHGRSDGVGPDSETFRFIDQLTTPPPPERRKPNRWKLRLASLSLEQSEFVEHFPSGDLIAGGASMEMDRNANDDFTMRPRIENLTFVINEDSASPQRSVPIGRAEGNLTLEDHKVVANRLLLRKGHSFIDLHGTDYPEEHNRVAASLRYVVDLPDAEVPDFLRGRLHGEAKVTGRLADAHFEGTSTLPEGVPVAFMIGTNQLLFTELSAAWSAEVSEKESSFLLHNFSARSPLAEITLARPLSLAHDQMEGEASIRLHQLSLSNVELTNTQFELFSSGLRRAPTITLHGETDAALSAAGISTPLLVDGVFSQGRSLQFSLMDRAADPHLKAKGTLLLNEPPELSNVSFALTRFPIQGVGNPEESISLEATGTAHGPVALNRLTCEASFHLYSPRRNEALLSGTATINNGKAVLEVETPKSSLSIHAEVPLIQGGHGTISLNANNFSPGEWSDRAGCVSINGKGDYSFSFPNLNLGKGSAVFDRFDIGCAPYTLKLPEPMRVTLVNGTAQINEIDFRGTDSNVALNGKVSAQGYELKAAGKISLRTLLPFVTSLDDLQGQLNLNLQLRGPLSNPTLLGTATIQDAALAAEAAGVSADHINGQLSLAQDKLRVEKISGSVNSGSFSLDGEVSALAPETSLLRLHFQDVFFEPNENSSVALSGSLAYGKLSSGKPGIQGDVTIDSAEFQQTLDVRTLLRVVTEYLFSRPEVKAKLRSAPDVELDINVRGARNLFVITNWLGAELRASLHITGLASNPEITGKVETVTGWFGIKDRRFEITSGALLFRPGLREPQLEVISEAYIRSLEGDNILVILEATGPLSQPHIKLTSDQGLSERELLALITSGESLSGRALTSDVSREWEYENRSDPYDPSFLGLHGFVRSLTRIESLSIEPVFNTETGLIEPAVVATKRLTDDLSLIGQTFFSGTDSRVEALYQIQPKLTLAGIADAARSQKTTTLGVDLGYTVWSDQMKFLTIHLAGNHHRSTTDILKTIRLGESSRIPAHDLDRIEKSVRAYYTSLGYLDASAQVHCTHEEFLCRDMTIDIVEGEKAHVHDVVAEGSEVPAFVTNEVIPSLHSGTAATKAFLDNAVERVLGQLRSEGFIGARVEGDYRVSQGSSDATLVLTISPGQPVSFTFLGNHLFSAEDFLETIHLFRRKQPFGNNTITILVQNIERLYRERGYLYATIRWHAEQDPHSGRLNYVIEISEEQPVSVSRVVIESDALNEEYLRNRVEHDYPQYYRNIFYPNAAIAEQLENNVTTLKELLVDEGFPEAEVHYRIDEGAKQDQVEIHYLISEGAPQRFAQLTVKTIPEDVHVRIPALPSPPYSIVRINRYIEELIEQLKSQGYLFPQVTSSTDNGSEVHLELVPGVMTKIHSIAINGDEKIDRDVVRRNLLVREGDPWDSERLEESRRKLFKLGLFSRVEIAPTDGTLDQPEEDLSIRLRERPLRTLNAGVGANSEYGLHLFGEATDKSLFRDGRSLSLRVDTFYDRAAATISQGVAGLRYADPYFFRTNYALNEDLRFQRLNLATQEFDYDRISLASYLYRSWESGFTNSFGHTILRDNLDNVTPDAVIGAHDTGIVDVSFISGALNYDGRDEPINPQRGFTLSFDYKLAARQLASEVDFYALGTRATAITALPGLMRDFSLAASSRAASAWTFGGTEVVPITQRYYLGGRNSIRGFQENALGPRGVNGAVIGGDLLFSNSFEFRYRLVEQFSVHTFLDIGTVYLKDRGVNAGDLREGTGVGFRYLSPIGPIGVDIGHPVDRQKGEAAIRFHFSIGSNF